jgi:hypothetical protein
MACKKFGVTPLRRRRQVFARSNLALFSLAVPVVVREFDFAGKTC